jgi:hypothetical protein
MLSGDLTMMTFLLAAAAAAAQPAVTKDPDVHCMAAYLIVAGNAKDDATATAEDKAGIQAIVMYFLGKLDARRPGADFKGEIMRLVASPDYATMLKTDVERCSTEAQGRGTYLQSFGQGAEASPAKP